MSSHISSVIANWRLKPDILYSLFFRKLAFNYLRDFYFTEYPRIFNKGASSNNSKYTVLHFGLQYCLAEMCPKQNVNMICLFATGQTVLAFTSYKRFHSV